MLAIFANNVYVIDIDALLAQHNGLILAREHRRLKSSLSRWVKRGLLVRLMRGVYAHPGSGFEQRLAAVATRIPDAVIGGAAAMVAWTGRGAPPPVIDVCTPTHRMPQSGYRFAQRRLPPEYVTRGFMSPVMAAVDRADDDADWIDDLVREKHVAPQQFLSALAACPGRVGNRARRQRVNRTFTNPWSPAERRFHDIMDDARITGWVANHRFEAGGRRYDIDVAFRKQRLAIEIDGWGTHGDRDSFEYDRQRQNDLVAVGWTVLRFTWAMLDDPEQVAQLVGDMLKRLDRAGQSRIQIRKKPANAALDESGYDFVPLAHQHLPQRASPRGRPRGGSALDAG